MDKSARIYVADNDGLIGREVFAELKRAGSNYLLGERDGPRITDGVEVDEYFARNLPRYVFLIGGRTGGITANQRYPADFMRDNLSVNCHVIESAHRHGVQKLLYLASSCVYPKFFEQPMIVEYFTTGKFEPTNEPYSIAKLAGL